MEAVHREGIIHRDLTPDNIYITNNGAVKLLDFGAARYSLGDKSRSLDVILKHGFAPKEQYTRRGKQGPFTDIYSLGATFYFALTGKRPPDSVERLDEDDLVPPSRLGVKIEDFKEDALLRALSPQPQDRFQSMIEFKNALISRDNQTTEPAGPMPPAQETVMPAQQGGYSQAEMEQRDKAYKRLFIKLMIPIGIVGILLGVVIVLLITSGSSSDNSEDNNDSKTERSADNSSEGRRSGTDKYSERETTPLPTSTAVPTSTPVPTPTPVPTATPTPLPTATPKPTATPRPTATPKPTEVVDVRNMLLSDNSVGKPGSGYIIYESAYRYLTMEDLYGLTAEECKLARNEIYARHGRKFTTKSIQDYFNKQSWYKGTIEAGSFKEEDYFNDFEKANVEFIKEFEDNNYPSTYQYYYRHENPSKIVCFKYSGSYYRTTITLFLNVDMKDLMYIECIDENEKMRYYGYVYCSVYNDGTIKIYNSKGGLWREARLECENDWDKNDYSLNFRGGKWNDSVYDKYVYGMIYGY